MVSDFLRPQAPHADGAVGTGAHTDHRRVCYLPWWPAPPARPEPEQHLNPPTVGEGTWSQDPGLCPCPHPTPAAGSEAGGPGRGSHHLQFTLQRMVQGQGQGQWEVHPC